MRKAQFQISDFFIFALFVLIMIILLGMITNQKEDMQEVVSDEFSYVGNQLLLTTFMRAPVGDPDFAVDNIAGLVALSKTDDNARRKLEAELTRFVEQINTEELNHVITVYYTDRIAFNDKLEVGSLSGSSLYTFVKNEVYVPATDGEPIKVEIWSG